MAKAKKKKRADHYDDKLSINGSFEDVIRVSVTLQKRIKNKQLKRLSVEWSKSSRFGCFVWIVFLLLCIVGIFYFLKWLLGDVLHFVD